MVNKYAEKNLPIFAFLCFSPRILAPRLLSSILSSKGYKSYIIFLSSNIKQYANDLSPQAEQQLLKLLENLKANIIGISLMSSYFQLAKKLTEEIKKTLRVPVIWGGVHPTIKPEDCIQAADLICIGEGEKAIVELAKALSEGTSIEQIPNIWLKNNGNIIRNAMRPLLKDLDTLPFPDYGNDNKYCLHKETFYHKDPLSSHYPEYEIISSRGCPYHCSYCINSRIKELYPGEKSFVRRRSPINVIDEIIKSREYFAQLRQIRFQDEVFAWDAEWVEEFCSLYKKKVGLPFTCDFHPNVVKSEVVAMLKKAGLESVGFGVQSTSQRVRYEVFKRPVSDQTLIKSARILQKQKINLYCDLIMNNPYENEADREEGLNFLLNFPRPYNWSMFFLRYYPHTTIAEKALKDGIISEKQIEGEGSQNYSNFGDPKRNLEEDEVFWYYLLILTSKSFIPRWLIKFIGNIKLFKKYPFIIKPLVFISHYVNMGILGFKKLWRGNLNYALLKVYLRQCLKPRN